MNWFALMDSLENDARYGDSTRLDSAAKRLLAAKALDKDGRIPMPWPRRRAPRSMPIWHATTTPIRAPVS
ncbi:MAG: hypothetical protein WDO12_05680 [Pseudomonadota bacterium]